MCFFTKRKLALSKEIYLEVASEVPQKIKLQLVFHILLVQVRDTSNMCVYMNVSASKCPGVTTAFINWHTDTEFASFICYRHPRSVQSLSDRNNSNHYPVRLWKKCSLMVHFKCQLNSNHVAMLPTGVCSKPTDITKQVCCLPDIPEHLILILFK